MRCWPRPRKRIGAPPVEARLLNGLNCLAIWRMQRLSRWIIAALCCRGGTRWAELSHRSKPAHSYRSASAGSTDAAADEGYSVASSEIPIETAETITPSSTRGANGNVSME